MNFYEDQVIKLERRIKRIEENPDPSKPKSNKIRYQADLELAKEQLEGWRQGKPFSDGGSASMGLLTRAMGFIPTGGAEPAFQTTSPLKYMGKARDMGLPIDNSCDMTMMPFAMMVSGDLPIEDVAICTQYRCTPMGLKEIYIGHTTNSFTYFIDTPIGDTPANIKYMTEQHGEFIEFCEKRFPGVIKYDEDRLIELQTNADIVSGYTKEVCEMFAHKPSPLSGKDTFAARGTSRWGAGPVDVEYARVRRDEVAERIAKGIAAVPGEKSRVFWTGITNPVFMDPYKALEKWKITVFRGVEAPGVFIHRLGEREPTPLEKLAKHCLKPGGAANVDNDIAMARLLQVDGIVFYNMLGCTTALGLRKIVEERAEKELGIPTLQLEGKQWDSNYASEAMITAKLDEFAQILLSSKGLI